MPASLVSNATFFRGSGGLVLNSAICIVFSLVRILGFYSVLFWAVPTPYTPSTTTVISPTAISVFLSSSTTVPSPSPQ